MRASLIPTSIAIAVFLSILHYAVATILPSDKRLPDRGPIAAAQQFILNDVSPDIVILGSSFADRLDPFNTNPQVEMITINGGSAFDGLAMLQARSNQEKNLPNVVAIEVNRLIVYEEKDWLKKMLSQPNKWMWSKIKSFQDANRPTSIFGWPIHVALNKANLILAQKLKLAGDKSKLNLPEDEETQSQLLELNLIEQRKYLETGISQDQLVKIHQKLSKHTEGLREKGVHIVFFHMPIHFSLENLSTPKKLNKVISESFEKESWDWVEEVDAQNFNFTDGIHLDPESAQRYHAILSEKLNQALN